MYPRSGFGSGGTCERTLVPVFIPGEHANVPSFRFSFQGKIRMYHRSGFRSGGTPAKATLQENHPVVNPWEGSGRDVPGFGSGRPGFGKTLNSRKLWADFSFPIFMAQGSEVYRHRLLSVVSLSLSIYLSIYPSIIVVDSKSGPRFGFFWVKLGPRLRQDLVLDFFCLFFPPML